MSPDNFRRLALGLPESAEGTHMGHADFRVKSKIFASLNAQETEGNLKLEPGRQKALIHLRPGVFSARNGAWGAQGWTRIALAEASPADVSDALWVSWRLVAPAKLVRAHPEDGPRLRCASPEEIDLILEIDDDACAVYGDLGMDVELSHDHPFVQAERARWLAGAQAGRVWLCELGGALAPAGPVGFVACDTVDGLPYLDQVSVRRASMQRGLGGHMLRHALGWAGAGRELWLTTYAHLAWNAPFYAHHGFALMPEAACGPEIRTILESQRACLPMPEQRVAMRWVSASGTVSTRTRSPR